MDEKVRKAIQILQDGGIVLLPTDTVFGICCRMDRQNSLKRLFKIKKRDEKRAVPVFVSSTDMAKEYVLPYSGKVEKLMETYWPGGLTIILLCREEKVLPLVRGSSSKLGIRIPDFLPLFQIIEKVGVPIVGTSANFHGKPSVAKYKDLDSDLVGLVDYVLEEDSLGSMSSTVIDCSKDKWEIVREGVIRVRI